MNLDERYVATRQFTERLCEPLAIEDYVVQAMPDASPTRWHLAHTTWFFETFLLAPRTPGYRPFSQDFQRLFNSYYNSIGEQFPRAQRGLLTRPTVAEVFEYRRAIDARMGELLAGSDTAADPSLAALVELGLQHEQQHQELILTDLKYLLSCNPLAPVYRPAAVAAANTSGSEPASWTAFDGGLVEVGFAGEGFYFDNERPRHTTYLQAFELQNRLVTAGEYLSFIDDGGYRRPELWLSLGWATMHEQGWNAPLYWSQRDGVWHEFTLSGSRPIERQDPVTHLSYFEADAYARWAGARLPTEFEWEHAAQDAPVEGTFADSQRFHPAPLAGEALGLAQMYGDVWQWTQSSYAPYPGYRPPPGALGEYNGKFMCNQYVLRGGSCATPAGHVRSTYRNFFPPDARWQFSGLRLARG